MNPLLEVGLIVRRELTKNLTSAKGAILIALAVLAASSAFMSFGGIDFEGVNTADLPDEAVRNAKIQFFAQGLHYDADTAARLATAPTKLVVLYYVAVWLAPLFIAIIGFDAISGELQHRTVRYFTVRTHRVSLYLGKYLGLLAIVSSITLLMHVLVAAIIAGRGEATLLEAFVWSMTFWAAAIPISAAWCALATLVGSQFKTPFLALLVIGSSFFVLFFVGFLLARATSQTWLRYLYPNTYDTYLLSHEFQKVVPGLLGLAAMALAMTAAGAYLFQRRDV